MATIYARLLNQWKFEYQNVFSARFDKQDEGGKIFGGIELSNILGIIVKFNTEWFW